MAEPTPQEQVEFLRNLQRLLTEGQFTATYKFALILALANLAVRKGDDGGGRLKCKVSELAEDFVKLYWRQAGPFRPTRTSTAAILLQNTSCQAAIIVDIANSRGRAEGESITRFRTFEGGKPWERLVVRVGGVVSQMPLWKLQYIGSRPVPFLYPQSEQGDSITLKPGVAYCFRAYYGIIRKLVEGAWLKHVCSVNPGLLGKSAGLAEFMFGEDRVALDVYRNFLTGLQRKQCFYCHRRLRVMGEVDHFIPWARYQSNLVHNCVIAHRDCNSQKSDQIAAEEHLAAWVARNESCETAITQFCDDKKLWHDRAESQGFALCAYAQTATVNGLTWIEGDRVEHLRGDWRRLLGAA